MLISTNESVPRGCVSLRTVEISGISAATRMEILETGDNGEPTRVRLLDAQGEVLLEENYDVAVAALQGGGSFLEVAPKPLSATQRRTRRRAVLALINDYLQSKATSESAAVQLEALADDSDDMETYEVRKSLALVLAENAVGNLTDASARRIVLRIVVNHLQAFAATGREDA